MQSGVVGCEVVFVPKRESKGKKIKSKFRGRSEHALDSKGRLNFPSRFREVLQKYDEPENLVVVPWGEAGELFLRAFPEAQWEKFEAALKAQENSRLFRFVSSNVQECSLDKQGRINIPLALRKGVGLDRDVVLVGMVDYVEIWDRERWDAEQADATENFEDLKKQFNEMGIF